MGIAAVAPFAEVQHGLVTRAQVLTVMTENQLEHLVKASALQQLRRCVYVVAGCPDTWHQRVLAACLAARPRAVASFRAAAVVWELDGFQPGLPEITVPGRQRRRLPGVRVHDSKVMGPGNTDLVSHIPVTSVARTIWDLTAVVPLAKVRQALADARRRQLVSVPQLERVFRLLATRGRRRSTVMRALLERELEGYAPGGSDTEVDIVRWIVEAGLPRPVQQYRIDLGDRVIWLDAAYPDLKIAIEYDGWEWHRGRAAFDEDRARDNDLELRDWLTLRFTSAWSRRKVVDTVEAAIERRMREQATLNLARARSSVACSDGQAMQSAPNRMRSSA